MIQHLQVSMCRTYGRSYTYHSWDADCVLTIFLVDLGLQTRGVSTECGISNLKRVLLSAIRAISMIYVIDCLGNTMAAPQVRPQDFTNTGVGNPVENAQLSPTPSLSSAISIYMTGL